MIKLEVMPVKDKNGCIVKTVISGNINDVLNELCTGAVDILTKTTEPLSDDDKQQILQTFVTSIYENFRGNYK